MEHHRHRKYCEKMKKKKILQKIEKCRSKWAQIIKNLWHRFKAPLKYIIHFNPLMVWATYARFTGIERENRCLPSILSTSFAWAWTCSWMSSDTFSYFSLSTYPNKDGIYDDLCSNYYSIRDLRRDGSIRQFFCSSLICSRDSEAHLVCDSAHYWEYVSLYDEIHLEWSHSTVAALKTRHQINRNAVRCSVLSLAILESDHFRLKINTSAKDFSIKMLSMVGNLIK